MSEQLDTLRQQHGILKQDIAKRMRIDPSYISQLLQRGMDCDRIAAVAKSAGVAPQYFDEYVASAARQYIMADRRLLEIMRALCWEADEKSRERFFRVSEETLGKYLSVNHEPWTRER